MTENYKFQFIKLALDNGVLLFGNFKLKSGQYSPYFFNTGMLNSSSAISGVADMYATLLLETKWSFDLLLGCAYKGIPLVSATAVSLYKKYGLDIKYSFNRKEEKKHGDGGLFVGGKIEGKIILIDDVITAGKAIADIVPLIKNLGGEVIGVLVALDRMEQKNTDFMRMNIPVVSIVSIDDIIHYATQTKIISVQQLKIMLDYRDSVV